MEIIKHFFGFCGESWQPNLWMLTSFLPFYPYLKQKFNLFNRKK
jgi:hypothetical protein